MSSSSIPRLNGSLLPKLSSIPRGGTRFTGFTPTAPRRIGAKSAQTGVHVLDSVSAEGGGTGSPSLGGGFTRAGARARAPVRLIRPERARDQAGAGSAGESARFGRSQRSASSIVQPLRAA